MTCTRGAFASQLNLITVFAVGGGRGDAEACEPRPPSLPAVVTGGAVAVVVAVPFACTGRVREDVARMVVISGAHTEAHDLAGAGALGPGDPDAAYACAGTWIDLRSLSDPLKTLAGVSPSLLVVPQSLARWDPVFPASVSTILPWSRVDMPLLVIEANLWSGVEPSPSFAKSDPPPDAANAFAISTSEDTAATCSGVSFLGLGPRGFVLCPARSRAPTFAAASGGGLERAVPAFLLLYFSFAPATR